jgi:hypothetical protein
MLASSALLAGAAKADVIIDLHLSGTGDNVITESVAPSDVIGGLNGTHPDLVLYNDLTPGFTSASTGNDIKLGNTSTIFFQVYDPTLSFVVPTATQVFSLKGTGDVTAIVQATDGPFSFDLGMIDPSAQSGFTFRAINMETITAILLTDSGGMITDFEHNRIDVASVPEPATLALFGVGLVGLGAFARRRRSAA